MSDSDPSVAYDRLRSETAEMLKLDPANLSLVEGLQLDLIALLRLTTSDMQGAALAGEQVDLGRLASALGMLRQLLPEKSLVASPAAASETRFGVDHRAKLKDLIERTLRAAETADAADDAERSLRDEQQAVAAAGNIEAPAAPVAPQPEPSPANVVPFEPKPPLHYLADHQHAREPWRNHYDGVVTGPSPWPLPR